MSDATQTPAPAPAPSAPPPAPPAEAPPAPVAQPPQAVSRPAAPPQLANVPVTKHTTPASQFKGAQQRAAQRAEALQKAVKAVQAVMPKEPETLAAPATTPPAQPAIPPAATTAPSVVPPVAPPAAPDKTWQAVREAEKVLAAQRDQLAKEAAAFNASRAQAEQAAQKLQMLQNAARQNPAAAIAELGIDDGTLAQYLVAKQRTAAAQPAAQPVAAPSYSPEMTRAWEAKLQEQESKLSNLASYVVNLQYDAELNRSDFDILRSDPNGKNLALQRAELHRQTTNNLLTPAEACAMAQDELIARRKAEYEKLSRDPTWSKVLGITAATPPPVSTPAAQSPAETLASPTTGLTTLTNDTTYASPPARNEPAQPAYMKEMERLRLRKERVIAAIRGR